MAVELGTADPLTGAVLDDRYVVGELIARGGMAGVYTALDRRLQRPVAVKVMHPALAEDPAFVERFVREARSAARVHHPNVIAVTDQGRDRSAPGSPVFLVMEHVQGRTLRHLLTERVRLTPGEVLELLEPVAAALAAAHAAGVVHRDVKPENVLLGDDGRVLVADFGLARAIEASPLTAAAGLLIGTVAYLAPEQVATGAADGRSDVYAAGILAFEMLTGGVPHGGVTPLAVAYAHLHEDVAPPSRWAPGTPPALDALVLACTAREPASRPADGAALLALVRQTRSGARRSRTAVLPAPGDGGALTARLDVTGERPPQPPVHPSTRPEPGSPAALGHPAPQLRPGRRRRWALVWTLVLLLVTAGAATAGWWFASGRYLSAPQLVGQEQAAAAAKVQHAHLRLSLGPASYSETVPSGAVLGQRPEGGARLLRGATVTVELSRGPERHGVPVVGRGATVAAATSALQTARLTVGGTRAVFDDAVPKGDVLVTDPPAGTLLRSGTAVALVLSGGPRPVIVPATASLNRDDAVAAVQAAKLTPTVHGATSTTVPQGEVIGTTPGAGTSALPGTTVVITMSLGPPLVAVPPLRGTQLSVATAQLQALGLQVKVVEVLPGATIVINQTPADGSVRVGTTVTLYGV